MFKFPLKRHHNNTNRHLQTKSASTRSNEGFIYIRCGHANNNNNNNNSNNNNNNNINHINNNNTNENNNSNNNINNTTANNDCKSNSNCNIPDIPPAYHGYNENVAKSTVQSSWRPQLPLPKEVHLSNENINHHPQHNFNHHNSYQPEDDVDIDEIQIIESDMERFHLSKKDASLNGSQISNASHNGSTSNKKWSFGRLFRRKKEVETESSSEEDRKAGFLPLQKHSRSANSSASAAITSTPNKKNKSSKSSASSRGSKLMSENFDHVIVPPTAVKGSQNHVDNEFFLPLETVPAAEPYYQNKPVQQTQQRLHHSQQYLPHVPQTQQQLMSRSVHSLDRRTDKAKQRSLQKMSQNGLPSTTIIGSSSEEEIISLNSTTFAKYRSDESIHSGGQSHVSGQSRRSRAARNERYYKRLSRDGEVSHGQVPVMYAQQPTQRWKTQPVPLSIYQAPKQQVVASQQPQPQPQSQMRASASQNSQYSKLRNTNSLQHMAPYVQWGQMQQQQQSKNLQNSVNDTKRSISYDSHIHLQNANGRLQNKPMPPPPPPRDPLRRVNVSGHMQEDGSGDLRPMSYAFDQTGVPVLPTTGLNGRCVSDDKIWAQQPHYQSIHSLNITPNQTSQTSTAQPNRRFITRAERDAQPGKKSLPNGLEFHYVADATPRSRKPIHLLEPNTFENDPPEPLSSGVLRTTKSGLPTSPTKVNATEFWKRLEGSSQNVNTPTPAPRGRDAQRANAGDKVVMKPRSVSSSRVGEMRAYPVPMYSEVYKPKNKTNTTSTPPKGGDEVDGVICGSLHIKPVQDKSNSYVEIRNKDENKSKSMPNNYQRRSGELPTTPNKYEEYVNERREQHLNPLFDLPQPPQRKLSGVPQIPQLSFPRKKPANLEEAINELEAIYRSLGLTEEPETKKERVPTPNDFEKYAVAHADEYEDEDSPTGEPDPVRDDVAFRNIKLANLQHKTVEKQPPFGIPVGPIVPAAQTDYLHVTPKRKDSGMYELKSPDVVKDDLAVRALRKELGESRTKFQYPSGSLLKKNRATRTQSANIYALIQRDAAKPSGGDLHSYLELTKNIDRSGSMSDLHKHDSASDIPTTLKLLQNLREQEREQNQNQNQLKKIHIPFRHPSQGGAICQLPEKLSSASHEEEKRSKPVPMPRKSMTPEPRNTDTHKMEEALNKIAQDAQESSIKLTQELKELRKEALITASRPRKVSNEEEKLEKELQEIEKVTQAAKQCGQLLLDTLPDVSMEEGETNVKKRKLHKEDKLIKAIDQVSEAANKVCEKILKDIVTTEPPVVVQEAVKITQTPLAGSETKDDNLVMPTLIKKLDPIQSTNIEAIARRCMRQLSDLGDNHDYDNLNQPDIAVASTCNIQQVTKDEITNDLNTSNLTETRKPPNKPMAKKNQHSKQIEEIDQIMKECEDQAKQSQIAKNAVKGNPVVVTQHVIKAPGSSTTTASSFSSSSDCLAKSSSPSGSRPFSSSITSFNPYSSSDYIKSPSSEFHAPSTDPIKTFSTTSYDVQSTASATPNLTTISTFSYSPSPPPLNLTPVSNCSATIASYTQRGRSSSPSQYNSSEELAMIFGIEEKTKTRKQPNNNSGKDDATPELRLELEQEKLKTNAASLPQCTANATTTTTTTTATTTDPCECCCAKTNDYPLFLTPNSCSQTNTASSSPISSLASSSSLLRLEAIPESSITGNAKTILVKATEKSEAISPHFNRVYASKFRIIVDKMKEDTTHTLIQYNSLSSLEESCSNPDSGNVSLADFPLGQHNINNSIQLNPNFNSRYEIRNCFKTEISIDTEQEEEKEEKEEENKVKKPEQKIDKEFPRLPTAEELANSLKEHCSLEQSFKKTAEFLGEQNSLKEKLALTKEDRELIGERIIWARDEIMAEVKALENKALKEKHQQEILERKEREKHSNGDEFLKDVSDGAKEVPKRKRSIVIETPLLEMNIMEEKINYEFNVSGKVSTSAKQEALQLQELAENCESLKQALNEEINKQCHAKKEAYEPLNQALNMDSENEFQNEGNKEFGSSEVTQKCQALNRTLNEDNQKEIDNEFSCLNLAQNCPDIQALNENLQIEIQEEMVNKMKTNIDDDHDFSLALNKSFQNDNHNKRETKDHIEVVNEIVSHEVAHDLNQALNDRNQEDKQNMNKNNETNEEIHCLENLNQALNADRVQEDKQNCQDLSQSLNQENRTENHKLEDLNQALNTDLQNETNDYRLRVWQPSSLSHSDDMPSTSSKALANSTTNMVVNVMGEQRPAVNSLTLLEHLVVACTLGVISTDDLFTLCLIIIGIIVVIAIALF